MKYLLSIVISMVSVSFIFAQANVSEQIKTEAKACVETYNLTQIQSKKVEDLLSFKYEQLNQIKSLKSSDPIKFRQKRRAIYKGHEGSIQLMLTEQQKEMYEERQRELRIERAKKIDELKRAGASQEDLKDASLGIDN